MALEKVKFENSRAKTGNAKFLFFFEEGGFSSVNHYRMHTRGEITSSLILTSD